MNKLIIYLTLFFSLISLVHASPQAWWKLDTNNTTQIDSTGNNNTGYIHGGVYVTNGNVSGAYHFENEENMTIQSTYWLQKPIYTYDFYLYRNESMDTGGILQKGLNGVDDYNTNFVIGLYQGSLYVYELGYYSSEPDVVVEVGCELLDASNTSYITPNQWHHIRIETEMGNLSYQTLDGLIKVYVDGVNTMNNTEICQYAMNVTNNQSIIINPINANGLGKGNFSIDELKYTGYDYPANTSPTPNNTITICTVSWMAYLISIVFAVIILGGVGYVSYTTFREDASVKTLTWTVLLILVGLTLITVLFSYVPTLFTGC